MKNRVLALFLTLVLLLPLTACGEKNKARPASGAPAPEPSSHLIQSAPPETVPQADDALVREIVLLYGAREDDTMDSVGKLRPQIVSLYYLSDSWSDAEQLEPICYFTWYYASTYLLDGDYENIEKLYMRPGYDFRVYPQDLYEGRIQQYFEVSTEHLRSDPDFYHPECEGYYFDRGPGKGESPEITYTYEQDGDILTIRATMNYEFSTPVQQHTLTVRLEPDGGWKYLGCQVS